MVVGYMAVRAVLYHFMPVHSLEAWSIRDDWMTLPRVAAFAALLLLNRFRWQAVPFDFASRDRRALFLGAGLLAITLFDCAGYAGPFWPQRLIWAGMLTTPFVGLFEEYAFRGAILAALLEKVGRGPAIAASALLFMAYHIQAQPLGGFPDLFLIGVILANLRLRGASLCGLALLHTVIDSVYFFFKSDPPGALGPHHLAILAALAIYAVLTWPRNQEAKWSGAAVSSPLSS